MSPRRILTALAAGALLLGVSACSDDAPPFSGNVLENPYQVPDTELTGTDGQPYSLAKDTNARLTLVFFGYTRCQDVCPAVLNNLARARLQLSEEDREQMQVVMVSSDPTYDTPEIIRSYLDGIEPSFLGATADFDTIETVAEDLGTGVDRDDPGAHTTYVLGVDSADEAPVYWSQDTTPGQFAADIHTLLQD